MSRITNYGLRITLFILLLFATVSAAFAQDIVTDDEVNEVAHGLYCPVCESEPLDTCPTQACIDWREEIRAQLAEGQTKEQIYATFRARYGDRVLAEPPVDGVNLILWFTIPIALIVGGYLFMQYLQRIRQPMVMQQGTRHTASIEAPSAEIASSPQSKDQSDKYVRRIENELRNL